jgi:hypothetical protein
MPVLVGYARREHFEYIGLGLLGRELQTMLQPGRTCKAWDNRED